MRIDLDKICLDTYDKNNDSHRCLIDNFKGVSNSKFISQIDNRLELNNKRKSFPFDTGFVVSLESGDLIGYIFISQIQNDEVYLEYSILANKRKNGYGKLMLEMVTNYLFENFNIRNIALDIDISNEASMKTATSCGYYDDEFLSNNKIIYRNYNLNYLNKRKKGR